MKKCLLILLLVFCLPLIVFAASVGQITKLIEIEDVLRGQSFDSTLLLYGSETEDIAYELIPEGDIETWTTFFELDDSDNLINKTTVLQGTRKEIIARFLIPDDVANGEYRGQITILTVPVEGEGAEGASATVRLKVSRPVLITVTDKEIIQFDTAFIPNDYDIPIDGTLEIRVIYDNQGNVVLTPDLQLKITRAGEVIYTAIFPYPENEDPVKPKTRKEIESILWPSAGQDEGNYRAEISVLLNGDVEQEHDFRFTIGYDKGINFLAAIAFIGGGNLTLAWIIIGLIFVVLTAALTIWSKRGKKIHA